MYRIIFEIRDMLFVRRGMVDQKCPVRKSWVAMRHVVGSWGLVHTVGDGVSWVQLDLGQGSLGGSWGSSNNSLDGSWSWGNQWSGIAQVVGTIEAWGISTVVAEGTAVDTAVDTIVEWSTIGQGSKGSWDQAFGGSWGVPLLAGASLLKSLQVGCGSLSNLWGEFRSNWELWVEDWCLTLENWSNQGLWVEDWCLTLKDWGNWQVGGLDTESQSISLVVDSLELAIGINVAVSALRNAESSVASLVLGRVDVAVSVSMVGELILRVELLGQWGSWGNGDSGNWSSSNGGWGSNSGDWSTSVGKARVDKARVDKAAKVWVDQDLGVGRGSQSGNSSDKSLHSECVGLDV